MKNLNKLFMFILVICLVGIVNFSTVKAEDSMSATLMEKKTTVTTDADAADTPISTSKHVGEDVCSESSVKQVIRMFGWMLYIAKLFVPFIIIVRGMFLFYKAVISDSDKDLKSSAIELGKKILAGILIFFIPTLIDALYDAFENFSTVASDYETCEECLLTPSKC